MRASPVGHRYGPAGPSTFARAALMAVLLAGTAHVPDAAGQRTDADIAARIDPIFARFDRDDSPGCVLGVGRNGEILYTRGYGMANLEHGIRNTPETILEIGSVSKQFTAGTVVFLEQQGKLSLDDDIRRWIPELPDFGAKITLRQLANHTAGLRGQWELLDLKNYPRNYVEHSVPIILDLIFHQRVLNFPPGDQYSYSNSGYTLLNEVVRRASGQTLAEYSRDHVFRPLGMMNTQWRDDHRRIVKNRMWAYMVGEDGDFKTMMPFTNTYGNGGLLTTVHDMIRWTESLNADRIGRPGFREQMLRRTKLNDGREISYALGITVDEYRGLREVSHGGATAGYRAHLTHFPEAGLTVAIGCNVTSANAGGMARQVAEVYLADRLEASEPTPPRIVAMPAAELAARAGLYRNPETQALMRLEARDGRLVIVGGGGFGGGAELVPVSRDRFRRVNTGTDYSIARLRADGPFQLRVVGDDDPYATFVFVTAASPSTAQLADYAGDYHSPELEVTYTMLVQDGSLVLRRRLMADEPLDPTFADGFSMPGFRLVFSRNAAGRVDGFGVWGARVRNVRFDRR